MDLPNKLFVKYSSVCLRSAKETFLSMYKPSTWWNTQWDRAEMSSFRNTRPGERVRIGGMLASMCRTCTDEVCVRNNMSGFVCTKKVSCMSRAGWCSGRFKAVKLCQSSSISGPTDKEKPSFEKISMTWLRKIEIGWSEPTSMGWPGREKSIADSGLLDLDPDDFLLSSSLLVAAIFRAFNCCPKAFFWSLGTFLKEAKSPVRIPFFPKNLIRKFSISVGSFDWKVSTSRRCTLIWSINCSIICHKNTSLDSVRLDPAKKRANIFSIFVVHLPCGSQYLGLGVWRAHRLWGL